MRETLKWGLLSTRQSLIKLQLTSPKIFFLEVRFVIHNLSTFSRDVRLPIRFDSRVDFFSLLPYLCLNINLLTHSTTTLTNGMDAE